MIVEGEVELTFKFQGHSNSSISLDIASSLLMRVFNMNVLWLHWSIIQCAYIRYNQRSFTTTTSRKQIKGWEKNGEIGVWQGERLSVWRVRCWVYQAPLHRRVISLTKFWNVCLSNSLLLTLPADLSFTVSTWRWLVHRHHLLLWNF